MEILKIARGRMVITLTRKDLDECGIDLDGARESDRREEAFEAILRAAREKTGMSLRQKENYIELYPAKDGGCEIFVVGRQSGECLALASREEAGRYLCRLAPGQAAAFARRLRALGEEVVLYDDRAGGRLLLSTASARSALLLEEFGARAYVDPLPYLNEHYARTEE